MLLSTTWRFDSAHPSDERHVMKKAIWNGAVLAESDETIEVEGNQYFPAAALDPQYFSPSERHTVCSWKGTASYFHVTVDGAQNADAAWTYPTPLPAAENITDYVAFWRGVDVVDA